MIISRASTSARRLLARVLFASLAGLTLLAASAGVAPAQRVDSARVGVERPAATRDTILGPPVTPRRAFLLSLAVPGLGQAALDRSIPGAIYITLEAVSIAMIQKSLADLRLAKAAGDSVVIGYEQGSDGIVLVDPATGLPIPIYEPNQLAARVSARRSHLEDWIVLLVFNHFFSGADAYVAAHLWEVPARVSMQADPRGVTMAIRVAW